MSSRRAGQIVRRGTQKWLIRVYRGTDPTTGKRRYENRTVHGSKKDADAELAAMLGRPGPGANGDAARDTLNEYLDRWLAASRERLRARTLYNYKRFLDLYARPRLGQIRLDKLRALDIQELYTEVGAKASTHAVIHTNRPLKAALNQAVRWGVLERSPAEGVALPKESRRRMAVLSADEVTAFQREAEKHPRGFIYTFTVATGLRPGEVQGLQWRDVDLKAGTISVRRSVEWVPGDGWRFVEPKTKLSLRTIPLPRSVTERLRIHQRTQAVAHSHARKRGRAIADHTLVFPDRNGNPISSKNLKVRVLRPILAVSKLDPAFRWYDCRHTCATLLLAAGENPKVVSERLGHSTVAFTLQNYAHVLPGMQRQASERLEALLFSGEHAQLKRLPEEHFENPLLSR